MDNDKPDDLEWLANPPANEEVIALPIDGQIGCRPGPPRIGIRVKAWAQLDGPSEMVH